MQARIDGAKQAISEQSLIAMIRDAVNNFENRQYGALLQQIEDWNTRAPDPDNGDNREQPVDPPKPSAPKVEIVGASDLSVSYVKPLLESEVDIDAYLESYKQALVNTVKQGKKVRL